MPTRLREDASARHGSGDGLNDLFDAYGLQALVPQPGGSFDGWGRFEMAEYVVIAKGGGTLFVVY